MNVHCGRKGARFGLVQAPLGESPLDSSFHVPFYNLVPLHRPSPARSIAQSPLQSVGTSLEGTSVKSEVPGGLIGR